MCIYTHINILLKIIYQLTNISKDAFFIGEMEQRKIMALGKSSRVISLPKTWLKVNKLDQGDRVSLYVHHDGSLIVHPSAEVREDVRKIHLYVEADESKDSIIRRIIGSYLNGYSLIKLSSTKIFTVSQQKAIRQIAGILYIMIIESEASSIVLETLIDESKASMSSGIQRMHMITYSMFRDILSSMKNLDEELARSVVSLEDDVDQLMYFLLRIIRSAAISPSLANQLGLDNLDCLDYQTLVHRIERIADHVTNIANCIIALIERKINIPEKVMTALIEAAKIAFISYEMGVQSYFSKDVEPTNEIIDKQKEIEEIYIGITPLPHFGDLDDLSTLYHIIDIRESIKKISHYAADIAELTIDRAYK